MTCLSPIQLPAAQRHPVRGDHANPRAVHAAVAAPGGRRHLAGGGGGGPVQPQRPEHPVGGRGQVDAQRPLVPPQLSQQVHAAAADAEPLRPRAAADGRPAGRRPGGTQVHLRRVVRRSAGGTDAGRAPEDDGPNKLDQRPRVGVLLDQDQSPVPSSDGPNRQRGH